MNSQRKIMLCTGQRRDGRRGGTATSEGDWANESGFASPPITRRSFIPPLLFLDLPPALT